MRSAAPALPAPWSGCARRTRRRNRRCTSSRSMARPGVEPEDLHRPPPFRRDAGPRLAAVGATASAHRRGRPGRRRPNAGEPLVEPSDLEPFGEDAGAGDGGVDEAERDAATRRRELGGGHDRADHLRRRAAVPVELEDRAYRPPFDRGADDAVAREVEPVGVGLQSVPQRDARHRQPPPGAVDEAAQRLELILVETGHVLGDHRADEHAAERGPAGGQVTVVDRHPARRHVPARVPDVQLGEQHARLRLPTEIRRARARAGSAGLARWDGASGGERRGQVSQMASMMALNVPLGRMAAVTSSSSGR